MIMENITIEIYLIGILIFFPFYPTRIYILFLSLLEDKKCNILHFMIFLYLFFIWILKYLVI